MTKKQYEKTVFALGATIQWAGRAVQVVEHEVIQGQLCAVYQDPNSGLKGMVTIDPETLRYSEAWRNQ